LSKLNLFKNEEIIWESYQAKKYRLFFFIRDLLILLLSLFVVWKATSSFSASSTLKILGLVGLLGLIFIAAKQIQLILVRYIVTNERVIIRRGLLNVRLTSINLVNILDTKVEQRFYERLINTGTVYLFTANDSQNTDENFIQNVPEIANIDEPFKRHTMIAEIIKKKKTELNYKGHSF